MGQSAVTPSACATSASGGATLPAVKQPLLLVSDLDDTLIGGIHAPRAHDEDTAALRDILQSARASGRVPVGVAINTGRTLALYEEAARAKGHCMPRPDALIAGVGTRVYFACKASGAWLEDGEWTAAMHERWSHPAVASLVDSAITSFGNDNIFWQRPIEQHEHKATFLYKAQLRARLTHLLESGLKEAGVEATVIDGPAGKGPEWRFVDVLPARAGKGAAMEWVRRKLGFAAEHTVACGDGPNDLLMLQQARAAICVGNSQPEVVEWARQAQQGPGQAEADSAHGAQERPGDPWVPAGAAAQQGGSRGGGAKRVHVARADAHAAEGILEGLRAFGFVE